MVATYTRLNPTIKAKFDYGVVMFLLTFCLVVVNGYHASNKINIVLGRIATVLLGVVICLAVSMLVFPIWAGDDLHRLIVGQFESLADSLEGFFFSKPDGFDLSVNARSCKLRIC